MIDLTMLYCFIVGMALLNLVFNCLALYRGGLELAFLNERKKQGFGSFFEIHKIAYIKTLIWLVLYVCIVGFTAARLLYFSGLWSIETALVGLVLMVFFTKERLHYITATFVMVRVNK